VALERFASSRSVQIVADRGRQPGDIVFETERGSLDASVETQLQEIGRGLADRLRGRW
jgi:flagellar assembly protein FliH